MDTSDIAGVAVETLSNHLERVGAGLISGAENGAIEQLQQVVFQRLRATRIGARVLAELEQGPSDLDRRAAAKDALLDEASRDPRFASYLALIVMHIQQGGLDRVGENLTEVARSNVANTGQWDVRRGAVGTAGPSVNRPRRTRIGAGGIVAIVLAATLAGFCIVGGVVYGLYAMNRGTPTAASESGRIASIAGTWYLCYATDFTLVVERSGDISMGQYPGRVTSPAPGRFRFEIDAGIEKQVFQGTIDEDGQTLTLVLGRTVEPYTRKRAASCPSSYTGPRPGE
jgi:hypothetical protein